MSKLRTIVIDDERLARINLKNLLIPFSKIDIVDEADSCKQALEVIRNKNPQVIFLDIQLIGESGFDILDKIDHNIHVVFVTAFDEYAIRAFEANAVDYLLKPVNPERLRKTINRLLNPVAKNDISDKKFEYNDAVYVKLTNKTSKFLKINSIVYISSIGNYSKLYSKENINYMVLKTMKLWEDELPKDNFVRVHRSTIVNIEHIARIEREASRCYKLYLKNMNNPFNISRRYLKTLKAKYKI
jgi:two-component system LytT family response regulator